MATNNQTNSSNYTVSDWNIELAVELIPNDVILTMYLILGITGNTLVILVYGFRMKKQSDDRYFIPFLAISDLSASIVCASFGIALNMMQVQFINSNLCKTWWFFAASTTYMSILLLGIIAVHRYLKVCRPLGEQMNLFWKRMAVIFALCLAFILGVPTTALYGSVDFPNLERNIVGRRCSKLKDVSKIGSVIYSGVAGIVLIVTIATLIVFYGKIGLTIYRHFKYISKSGLKKKHPQEREQGTVTMSESCSYDTKDTLSSDVLSSKTGIQAVELSPLAQQSDNLNNSITDKNTESKGQITHVVKPTKLRTKTKTSDSDEVNRKIMYKFTIMLMVITIVFILCYIPKVLLLAMEGRNPKFWENFSDTQRAGVLFVYRSYIINNVVNPYIYAFMDNKFRKEAIALLRCSKTDTVMK